MGIQSTARTAAILPMFLIAVSCAGPTTKPANLNAADVKAEAEKQQEIALQDYMGHLDRLQRVGLPILEGSVPLCKKDIGWRVGAYFATEDDFPKERREAAEAVLGLGHGLQIVEVASNGPADKAGLEVGDRIVSVNGMRPQSSGQITQKFGEVLKEQLKDGQFVTFVVQRDSGQESIQVQPAEVCDYALNVIESDDVNAFADGHSINVFTGMMRFADSDVELATVVGHELAHNAMGHMTKQRINAIPGLALDILAALVGVNTQGAFSNMTAHAFSKEFEAEADYVGLYAMAMSDIEIDTAPNFWRRMGMTHSESIKSAFNASHPATPERYLHLDEVVAEIKRKKAEGDPLMPDLKQ